MKDIPTQKLILIAIALTAIVAYVIPFDDLIAQQEEEGDGNGDVEGEIETDTEETETNNEEEMTEPLF